jgi:Tol biopolymer transport system component
VKARLTKPPCLIVLLAALVLPAGGSAAPQDGRSVFPLLTYVAANGGICLVRADGSHAVRLTPRWKRVGDPQWSPHGRYLAFSRFVGNDANRDPVTKISVADTHGRVHSTFGDATSNDDPHWSPDGRRLLFHEVWAHTAGFAVARPDGSHITGIAGCTGFPVAYCAGDPSWSADGQLLAFDDHDTSGALSIFTVRADGSDRRLMIANASEPAYAPRASKLAYVELVGPPDAPSASLFVADADGGNPHAITPPSRDVIDWLAWSPDASMLAFLRIPCATTCSSTGDLLVIRADGSGERVIASRLSGPILRRFGVAWSPGGQLLAFLRGQSIVVARADGRGERVVVSRARSWTGVTSLPAWRPAVALPAAERPSCPRR